MPPVWAFGWHQSRLGYKNLGAMEDVLSHYDADGIPLDALWGNLETMDNYRSFTVSPPYEGL